jgi:hypothetical protein
MKFAVVPLDSSDMALQAHDVSYGVLELQNGGVKEVTT